MISSYWKVLTLTVVRIWNSVTTSWAQTASLKYVHKKLPCIILSVMNSLMCMYALIFMNQFIHECCICIYISNRYNSLLAS